MDKGKKTHVPFTKYDYVVGVGECIPPSGLLEHIKFTELDDSIILENGKKPSNDWKVVASEAEKRWVSAVAGIIN